MMTVAAAGKINPFFIHRSDDVDDPWTAGMTVMRRQPLLLGRGHLERGNSTARAIIGKAESLRRRKKGSNKKGNKRSTTSTPSSSDSAGFRCTDRAAATAGAHLRDFMHATSMHGLKYAAEKEASYIER